MRTELLPGIVADLDLTDEVQRATYWQGERYEFPMLQILDRWVGEGVTHFFDIGSNYGYFSHALIARHSGLQAHAIEPNPVTFAQLEKIRSENQIARLNIWNLGLSDQCEILQLHRGLVDSGHSTFANHPHLCANQTDSVEVIDFESWRKHAGLPLPPPGSWIAKIDVEGFEGKVLSGMKPALKARAFRGLAIEINEFTLQLCHSAPDQIYSLMEEVGYEPLARPSDGNAARSEANEFFVPSL